MTEQVAVEFLAEVRQTKNMADHTYNVTLNLPEMAGEQAAWLLRHQLELVKAVIVIEPKEDGKGLK
jgi:hypothetical protein